MAASITWGSAPGSSYNQRTKPWGLDYFLIPQSPGALLLPSGVRYAFAPPLGSFASTSDLVRYDYRFVVDMCLGSCAFPDRPIWLHDGIL